MSFKYLLKNCTKTKPVRSDDNALVGTFFLIHIEKHQKGSIDSESKKEKQHNFRDIIKLMFENLFFEKLVTFLKGAYLDNHQIKNNYIHLEFESYQVEKVDMFSYQKWILKPKILMNKAY